jgi:fatty-acyl-CoA synthase
VRSIAGKLPFGSVARRLSLGPLGALEDVPFNARVLAEAGVLRPVRPDRLVLAARELVRWGPSPAAGIATAAISHPNDPVIEDEAGALTFSQLHSRTNALARGLRSTGVRTGDGVAIMCRNHRGLIEATLACSKLGAHGLYLNTAFAAPQLAEVLEREQPVALIYDQEFAELLSASSLELWRFVAWAEGEGPGDPTLDELIAANGDSAVPPPDDSSKFVILTSGTTGTPKGAQRTQPDTLGPVAALLSKIPLHSRERTMIAAPMFHSWGFAHFTLGMALNSTYVLRRRFDPEGTLRATAESGATALVVVPVMLQRIIELSPEVLARYDLRNLRVTAVSGSVLPGELATEWMDTFGDNLYNLYGSTEVAWATIATPEDLRNAPGTAGKPPRGTIVKLFDDDGEPVKQGDTGRIFVGNEMQFEGYTGGGGKDVIDGLMSSGDVGHFDDKGRLFIDGRDDDMIVSGGENVHPLEVEDVLAAHPGVDEVAVIGLPDERWGQRVAAVVVGSATAEELDAHCLASALARFKRPREYRHVDALPKSASGKILRRVLRDETGATV